METKRHFICAMHFFINQFFCTAIKLLSGLLAGSFVYLLIFADSVICQIKFVNVDLKLIYIFRFYLQANLLDSTWPNAGTYSLINGINICCLFFFCLINL